jgi:hypothetical protein
MAGLLACLKMQAAFAQGEESLDRAPQECISTGRINYTRVIDDDTILFYMISQAIYRNTLPQACTGLGLRQRFAYSTANGKLCDVDYITVPDSGRVVPCTLGVFQRITREEARMLQRDPEALDAIDRSIKIEPVELPPVEAEDAEEN